jgi:membrane carboxypeptidase/penicillin-binding protein
VAVEDKRFYRHHGFVSGVVRGDRAVAGMGMLLNRRSGGGSTITQQLARHMFEQITERRGCGLTRKLKELVAQDIEDVYSKDEILASYEP